MGRPNPDLRKVLNTILYVQITGCRWCDVPVGDRWAKRSTAHEWLGILQKDGGQEVDYGYKGKGVTNHHLVDGNGMPLSAITTAASKSERDQISVLFQRVKVYHGYGRPKRCPKEVHDDKGYDSKVLRIFLRNKGIKPVIPKRT